MMNIDLAFMDTITSICDACQGRRFKEEVLGFTLRGSTISEVLEMTVDEAVEFFREPEIRPALRRLQDVGIGYLTLGQPLTTLSGGELQRVKLAAELENHGEIYVLDEPTTGLHMSDTQRLIRIFDRLVDQGSTVIVIEHNLDVVSQADWIIDLGPGAGQEGGRVIFQGRPQDLVNCKASITGQYLRGR